MSTTSTASPHGGETHRNTCQQVAPLSHAPLPKGAGGGTLLLCVVSDEWRGVGGIWRYLGVVRVVVVLVVEKLGGDHYARDCDTMNVERCQRKVVSLDESVHVYQPKHEALVAAARVLEDSVEVPVFREQQRAVKLRQVSRARKHATN